MDDLPPELLQWMRFSPSHEKAIEILISKITGNRKEPDFIFEAEKSNLEPLDLKNLCLDWLDSCGIKIKYPEWWFFSPLTWKGKGMERTIQSGFWKRTGQPKNFMFDSVLIAKKEILVFHEGRGKEGKRTNWKIHQYQVTLKKFDGSHPGQRPFVLSRLFYDDESLVQDLKFAGLTVPSGLLALEVQATKTPENFGKTISSTITPVDCDGKSFSAHAAENQFGKLTATEDDLQQVVEMIYELPQRPVDFEILASSPSLHNNFVVSLPTTAKSSLEELESKQAFALESPISEEQSDNYLRKGHPEEIFDATTATALSNCNQNGYKATTSEFQEGFGLSDLLVPLDCSLSSPLTSDMHFGMSHSVSNDYNSYCGTYSEYGKNELSKFGDKFPDLASDYLSENFSNTFGCQKNLLLVSMKDNGSCSGSDAKMANESFQEGFGLSDLQVPLDCSLFSPLTSYMHFGMSHSVSNDYNSHCGMYSEYGKNELSKFGDKFPDLASNYLSENFSNTFGCQKNLLLVSMKDNGSCSGSDAKMANESFQEGFGLSDLQVPLESSLSSPLTSDMHFGMSHSISNDYNSHCGTSSEYGMNELSKFGDEFLDLASDYLSGNFPNMFGCQKDLPSVSMKDNGSCSGLDATLANTLFESTFQGSGESRKRKASSGLPNLESPHGINGKVFKSDLGSDCIPKNY